MQQEKSGSGTSTITGSPIELSGFTPNNELSPNVKPAGNPVTGDAAAAAVTSPRTEAMISYHEAALAQLYAEDLSNRKASAGDLAAVLAGAAASSAPGNVGVPQGANFTAGFQAAAAAAASGMPMTAHASPNFTNAAPFYQVYQSGVQGGEDLLRSSDFSMILE